MPPISLGAHTPEKSTHACFLLQFHVHKLIFHANTSENMGYAGTIFL